MIHGIELPSPKPYILTFPHCRFGAVSESYLRCCLLGWSPHFAPNKTSLTTLKLYNFFLLTIAISNHDAVKVLHSICQQIWKTLQWPQDWKRSVFIPIPKKGNAKECSKYCTIAVISHASKVMLKTLHARFQQCMMYRIQQL